MADFYQTGVVTTLHRLGTPSFERLEADLRRFIRQRPIALILPSLYQELEGPALPRIVETLKEVKFLRQIVVTLGRAGPEEFSRAREFFGVLPQETHILWNDGERMQSLYKQLKAEGIPAGADGKGRSVWAAFGLVLAEEKARLIALHDCDILTYSREMLGRLAYPVACPTFSYEYAKGYYARVTDRLHGRVTRLYITPLVRTLQRMTGHHPFLLFLDSFRYPLAGEFALSTELARAVRIPSDWGLEVGFLGEVFRNLPPRRVCEVDLAESYDHKHQELSAEDPGKGLMKMGVDIAKSLFRTLAAEGVPLDDGFFRSLRVAYLRSAEDQIRKYADDAVINGLQFDRHAEGTTIEAFARAIEMAAREVLTDPLNTPLIPNWNRVTSAFPDFLERLKAAVDEDNR